MKRLDGWKNPYQLNALRDERGHSDDDLNPNYQIYEAGADALSELLKAQGLSYENSMSMPRLAGFIYSRVAGKKGHIVFIEDEE